MSDEHNELTRNQTNLYFVWAMATRFIRFYDVYHDRPHIKRTVWETEVIESPPLVDRWLLFDMFKDDERRLTTIAKGNDYRYRPVPVRKEIPHWSGVIEPRDIESCCKLAGQYLDNHLTHL